MKQEISNILAVLIVSILTSSIFVSYFTGDIFEYFNDYFGGIVYFLLCLATIGSWMNHAKSTANFLVFTLEILIIVCLVQWFHLQITSEQDYFMAVAAIQGVWIGLVAATILILEKLMMPL